MRRRRKDREELTDREQAKKRKRAFASKIRNSATLEEALALLKIPKWWDVLIVGDGSGNNWNRQAGWGWTIIVRKPMLFRQSGGGALSNGSSIFAEIMATLHPLCWLESQNLPGPLEVFILTDCQAVQRWGSGEAEVKTYASLWSLLKTVSPKNLRLHWHHIPRDVLSLNQLSHMLANYAREMFAEQWPAAQDTICGRFPTQIT